MKYKQMCDQLKDKVSRLEYDLREKDEDLRRSEKARIESEARYEELLKVGRRYEAMESDARRENEWLKTTLRLVIVDADKIRGLATELEQNHSSLNYKI